MLIMLTYWSYYILTAAQILRAVNSWHYISLYKQGKGRILFMLLNSLPVPEVIKLFSCSTLVSAEHDI